MDDDEDDEPDADAVVMVVARRVMVVGFGNGGGSRKAPIAPNSNGSSSSSSQASGRGRFRRHCGRSAAGLAGDAMLGIRQDRTVGPVDVSSSFQERSDPVVSRVVVLDQPVDSESEWIDHSIDYE